MLIWVPCIFYKWKEAIILGIQSKKITDVKAKATGTWDHVLCLSCAHRFVVTGRQTLSRLESQCSESIKHSWCWLSILGEKPKRNKKFSGSYCLLVMKFTINKLGGWIRVPWGQRLWKKKKKNVSAWEIYGAGWVMASCSVPASDFQVGSKWYQVMDGEWGHICQDSHDYCFKRALKWSSTYDTV